MNSTPAVTLNSPAERPFETVADLGVMLRLFTGPPSWQHAGILYKLDNSAARVCHLRDHFDMVDEIPSNDFRWVQVDLDEYNRRLVAGLTQRIAERGDRIQYGFG